MFGFFPLLLLGIVGGLIVWVRRSRPHATGEAREAVQSGPTRVPLLIEAVGYLGTVLFLAGASAAIGQRWADISTAGRFSILAAATLTFLAIGTFIRSSTEPAFQRLTSVTWAVSVAAFASTAAVVNQFYDTGPDTAFVTITTSATAYAAILWLLHQQAIQQAVLFLGVLLSTSATIAFAVHEPAAWMIAIPLWAIGVAWAAGGWWRRLTPWFVAVPLGLLVALIAPSAIESSGVRFGLGIATAGTVMTLSVLAKFTPGLALASVAMLGYVVGAVTYYFGDALGVPASLTIAGLVILTAAAAATHWHWFSPKQSSMKPPEATDGHGSGTPVERHEAA